MSIYSDIGGKAALDAAVTDFYERPLADQSLAPYFEGIDLDRLRRHQRAFLTMVLGGPDDYQGRRMAAAHADLGITNDAFNSVALHLSETLKSLGVADEAIVGILRALIPFQNDVVTVRETAA